MKAILPLGIVGLVIAFLAGVLGSFPTEGAVANPNNNTAVSEEFSTQSVEITAQRFSSAYTWVVADLTTYIKDPDLSRAERQQQAMVEYANSLVPEFQGFSEKMKGKLDTLAAEYDANSTTAQ